MTGKAQKGAAGAEDDWADITRRMQAGDTDAFELYYLRMFDRMLAHAKKLTGRDEQTSLDIVHDSMLKVVKSIKPLADKQSVAAWSAAVVKSVAYDWFRKQNTQHRNLRLRFGNDHSEARIDDVETLDASRLLWVEEQLQSLPAQLQNLIALRYRAGWSLRRIGEKLGIQTGAVDGRIRRAIEQLKAHAKREFHD